MKERFLNILKWFFIALGVLIFAQIVFFVMIIIFANTFRIDKVSDIKLKPQKYNLKQMEKIIEYAQNYRDENGKFPKTIQDIKMNKNFEYNYSTSHDYDCYKIELKNTKTNATKQYEYCSIQKDGLTSTSENFIETQ